MKKIAFIAVAAMAFGFASCKKDYTCTCTGTGLPEQWKSFKYSGVKKKDAESTCDTQESQIKTAGVSDASCSI